MKTQFESCKRFNHDQLVSYFIWFCYRSSMEMEGMVDENGSVDPLAPSPEPPVISSVGITTQSQLVAATNIVHLTLPTNDHAQAQVA